jgi:hypothetical protein
MVNAAALHEAGHAVSMLVFSDPIARVSIEGEAGAVERPHYRRWSLNDEAGRMRALEYVVTCYAGPAAERRIGILSPETSATDRKMAAELVLRLCDGDEREARRLGDRLEALARDLVDRNWSAIETIATALSERGELSGAEIDQLLEARQ